MAMAMDQKQTVSLVVVVSELSAQLWGLYLILYYIIVLYSIILFMYWRGPQFGEYGELDIIFFVCMGEP